MEVEFTTVNENGEMVNKAKDILEYSEGRSIFKHLRKELGKHMIELASTPSSDFDIFASMFLKDIENLSDYAAKHGCQLLPLGTHPGTKIPDIVPDIWYNAKAAALGIESIRNEAKVCGTHIHYTLPKGIVGKQKRIKGIKRSMAKDLFLNQYNFLIAVDPATITFCQSTPFWYGINYAKDCRTAGYRDFRVIKNGKTIEGAYYQTPLLGGLPKYEFTLQDIRVIADQRKNEWLKLIASKKYPTNEIATYPTLRFMLGPLRVNKVGTFEYRGLDMNIPDITFGIAALLRHLLEAIEKLELVTMPSDIGISEPFKLEDDIVYLPPHSSVKYVEFLSTVHGFESKNVYNYCKKLLKLLLQISDLGKNDKALDRIKRMLSERKTTSDEILELAKKNGHDISKQLPEDFLNYIALYYAKQLPKKIDETRRIFER